MNDFKLPEHKQEYLANFSSNSVYVPSGKTDITFTITLMNLNYENGAEYYISLYIYDADNYKAYKEGKMREIEARNGGASDRLLLVAMLENSNYNFPDYIDLPINYTINGLLYEKNKIYSAEFNFKNKDGVLISSAITHLKGV